MEAKTSEDHLKVQKMKKKVLRKQVRAQHTLMRHEGIKCTSHATQVTGSCDFDGRVKMLLICVLFSCVLCKMLFLKMHFPRLRVFYASDFKAELYFSSSVSMERLWWPLDKVSLTWNSSYLGWVGSTGNAIEVDELFFSFSVVSFIFSGF